MHARSNSDAEAQRGFDFEFLALFTPTYAGLAFRAWVNSEATCCEICLQPDHDQDIVDAEHKIIVGRHEKWSTKDRDETNRRRQRHLSECLPNDR